MVLRVVFDPNVLVSAAIADGAPRQVIALVAAGATRMISCPRLHEEFEGVLARDRSPGMQPSFDDVDDDSGIVDGSERFLAGHLGRPVIGLATALEERPEQPARSLVDAPLAHEKSPDGRHDPAVLGARLAEVRQRGLGRVERPVVGAGDGLGAEPVVG